MKKIVITSCFTVVLGLGTIANATVISEIEDNNSMAVAQNIDAYFSLGANVDILDPEINPWVSIQGTGNETVDYYSFTVGAGMTGWFDIDYGDEPGTNASDFDFSLVGYNSIGAKVFQNHDGQSSYGAGGSTTFLDPYAEHTFTDAGTYYVKVTGWFAIPADGSTYTLQVSKGYATTPTPEPATILLFGTGLVALGGSRLRKKKK